MRIRSSMVVAGVTALLLSGGSAASAEPTWPSPSRAAPDVEPVRETGQVTLITGDRVLLQPDGTYAYLPAKGREDIGHITMSAAHDGAGDLYVIPDDAAAPLASGELDRRLFNVTALARDGFADAASLPLIVQYDRGARAEASIAGADRTSRLDSIDAASYSVPATEAGDLWERLTAGEGLAGEYAHVWLDGRRELLLDQSVPQVGAPVAWDAGYTGTGVTVAVLDTGYDPTHPDLAGRVTAVKDFTGTSPEAIDGYGHGTHVASTVAGTGAASSGKYKGVAPDAKLLIGKVCGDEGYCNDSDVIAGMQWAADNGATAANLSLGGGPTDGTDPLSLAVNEISEASGTLFVIAAGNGGEDEAVSSPASADEALAVGSVTKSDELSDFSSRGPRFGDGAVKPDISAPGSDIVAARAAGTDGPGPVDEFYTRSSGTSMATPHVTGAAALLKQAHPDWTSRRLKSALMSGTEGIDGLTIYQIGAGRLDIGRSVSQAVTTDVASLSFGTFAHPHGQPGVGKKLTYANGSGADVTLALDFTATTADGTPAPDGMYTVDKPTVTVPAGGTAEVVVTFHPLAGSPIGAYSGVLTATGGGDVVRTAVGGRLERELYDLTLNVKARTGGVLASAGGIWFNVDTAEYDHFTIRGNGTAAGTYTARVAPGRYEFIGMVRSTGGTTSKTSLAADVTVGGAYTTVVWDATKGARSSVDLTGRVDEVFIDNQVVIDAKTHRGLRLQFDVSILPGEAAYVVETGSLFSKDFRYSEHPLFRSPTSAAKAYRYNLYHETLGKMPKGTAKRLGDDQFFLEKATYHGQGAASTTGGRSDFPIPPNRQFAIGSVLTDVKVPSTVHEYFLKGGVLHWESDLYLGDRFGFAVEYQERVGTGLANATVDWNRAPLGPSVANTLNSVTRDGGGFHVNVPLYSGPKIGTYPINATTGTTTLLHEGEVIATTDEPCYGNVAVDPGLSGVFTLRCESHRSVEWSTIGTASSAEWTFTSGPAEPGVRQWPVLTAVRVGAANVTNGSAPAGQVQALTLDVERSGPGGGDDDDFATDPVTKRLRFEVSYDEGVTWKTVTVSRVGDHAVASLRHPTGATSVSVRVAVTDSTGRTSVQTTIKAYGLT